MIFTSVKPQTKCVQHGQWYYKFAYIPTRVSNVHVAWLNIIERRVIFSAYLGVGESAFVWEDRIPGALVAFRRNNLGNPEMEVPVE